MIKEIMNILIDESFNGFLAVISVLGGVPLFSIFKWLHKISTEKDLIQNPCKSSLYLEIFDNLIYLQFLKKKYCITLDSDQIIRFKEVDKLLGKRYPLEQRKLIYPYLNSFDDFKSIRQNKIPNRLEWFWGSILVISLIVIELIWFWVYIKIYRLLNGFDLVVGLSIVLTMSLFYFVMFTYLLNGLRNYIFAFNALKYINRKDDSMPVKEVDFAKVIFIAPFSNKWKYVE